MDQKQLNKILDNHKLWLESKGKKGAQANLYNTNLIGVNLTGANLIGANLIDADLEGANLSGADLRGTDLSGAYLGGVNLEGANLLHCFLAGAYLTGAKFTIEIRDVADLSHCRITKDKLPWLALHPDFLEFFSTLKVF